MPLPTTNLSLNAIHVEVGGSSGTSVSLNDADVRGIGAPDSTYAGSDGINTTSGSTISMGEFRNASANAFPATGSAWFQYTSGFGGDAPDPIWGDASATSTSSAQAGCNVGFQNDTNNTRIAMRWTTFTSASASSYSFAYVSYSGHDSTTFQAKCVYVTSPSGFVGSVENPASYSPASNTFSNVSETGYSPLWQWSTTVSSGSGTRSISSSTHPIWTVRSGSANTDSSISGPSGGNSISLQATRGTSSPPGGGFGDICVHEDMLVSTQNGNMTIDDIVDKAPPKIWSWNKDTNQKELCNLLEVKIVEHDNLYKINNIMITEDHPVYLEGYVAASVDPAKSKDNYDIDCAQLAVGNKLMKENGTLEEITSIAAYAGTHRTYTLKTTLSNFYADGVLVDSEI